MVRIDSDLERQLGRLQTHGPLSSSERRTLTEYSTLHTTLQNILRNCSHTRASTSICKGLEVTAALRSQNNAKRDIRIEYQDFVPAS